MKTPNPEQVRVIEDLSSNLLLFAGAGTGKTFTVAARVARILREGLARPEEILCLTFTIKACNEMREDILGECAEAGAVEIRTIHGFCRRLLYEEGLRTGAYGSEPVVCDEVDEEEILRRLFSERIPAWDMEREAKKRGLTLEELLSRDVVWLSAGENSGFYRRLADGCFLGSLGVLSEEDALPLLRMTDPNEIVCPACEKRQKENGNLCAACGFDFRTYLSPRQFPLGKYGKYRDFVSLLKHERARAPKSGDEIRDYDEAFARLEEREPEALYRTLSYRNHGAEELDRLFLGKARRYAGALMHAYREEMRAACRLDFDDLVIGARDLLRDETVCARWRKRYRYLIVDEMQDTSALEYEVLRPLFEGACVMACGDYFQTIYEWRGSRPREVLEDFRTRFHAKVCVFTENFRATETLAEAAFGFLQSAYPAETGAFRPERPIVKSGEKGEPVRFVRCLGVNAEAAFIYRYFDRKGGENACVMARSNRYIERLFRTFAMFNESRPPEKRLRFFSAGDFRFYKTAVVKDMLALFSLLLNPCDALAAARLSERYLRGVGPATLAAVRSGYRAGLSFSSFLSEETYTCGDPYRTLLEGIEAGSVVVYDTETTGLDLSCDEIIQIAAMRLGKDGREEFMRFVLPAREISEGALATHGYSLEFLREHGAVPQKKALEEFSDFVRGCVLVGHNGTRFDRPLVDRSLRDCGLPPLDVKGEYDTLLLSALLLPELPNRKLSTLCGALGVVNERAHDAFADVDATAGVLLRLAENYLLPGREERERAVKRYSARFSPLFSACRDLREKLKAGDAGELFRAAEEAFGFTARCERPWERENPLTLRLLAEEKAENCGLEKALSELVAEAALSGSEMDALARKYQRIPVVTVHQSKGCEFDTVILAGADAYSFPLASSVEDGREDEERRVFYVALTRAKKRLILTCGGSGASPRPPSPYLSLLPQELLERYESDGMNTVKL